MQMIPKQKNYPTTYSCEQGLCLPPLTLSPPCSSDLKVVIAFIIWSLTLFPFAKLLLDIENLSAVPSLNVVHGVVHVLSIAENTMSQNYAMITALKALSQFASSKSSFHVTSILSLGPSVHKR